MITRLVIDNHVTPSLNETLRESIGKKVSRSKFYAKAVMQLLTVKHTGPVRYIIERYTPDQLLDNENFIGGTKQLTDAIVRRGVLIDDKPAVIVQPIYRQYKIARGGLKKTVVIIEDVAEGLGPFPAYIESK